MPFDQLSSAECKRKKISKHVTEESLTLMHGWQLVLRFLAQLIRFINIIQVLHLKIKIEKKNVNKQQIFLLIFIFFISDQNALLTMPYLNETAPARL